MFHILYKYFAKLGLVKHYNSSAALSLREKKVEMDF